MTNKRLIQSIKMAFFQYFDDKYSAELRKRLKTNEFSIICSNCMGGAIYHRLGVQFQSPTVNQFMSDKDFFKFISNFEYYLNEIELTDNGSDGVHPLGLLGDIPVEFTHYKSSQEAIDAWNRRKKRINFDRLYLILFDTIDGEISREDILKFGEFKCANRIVLSKNEYPDIEYVHTIPLKENDTNNHYMNKNMIGRRRYEGKWDFVNWINEGIGHSS